MFRRTKGKFTNIKRNFETEITSHRIQARENINFSRDNFQFTFQIIGDPSEKLMKEMAEEEKQRVKEQRNTLGETGLKEKQNALEKATEENEVSFAHRYIYCGYLNSFT